MTGWSVNEPPGSTANPLPFGISSLIPPVARIGDPEVTLRVRGWGFVSGMELVINDKVRQTTFVSSAELIAKVTPPASGAAGRYPVQVKAFRFICATKDFNLLKSNEVTDDEQRRSEDPDAGRTGGPHAVHQ